MSDIALLMMVKPIIPIIRAEIPKAEPTNQVSAAIKTHLNKISANDKLGVRAIISDLIIGYSNENPEQVKQFLNEIQTELNK